MDLNHLDVFALVAETRGFTAAAKRMGVQRSSVSRAIAALEDELGVQLFARTTRSVALTTAGALLLGQVKPQLSSLHEAIRALPEREAAPSGVLTLTAPTDIGTTFLPAVIAGFLGRFPGVSVDLRLGNAAVDIVAEGIDCALRATPAKRSDSSLISRRLSEMEMRLVAAPTYLTGNGVPRTPAETSAHAWISFRGRPPPAPMPRPRQPPRVIADDMLFVRRAALAGIGIGVVPSFLVREDILAGALVRVLPKVVLGAGALYLLHAPTAHVSKKVTAFRDYFLEYAAAHPFSVGP